MGIIFESGDISRKIFVFFSKGGKIKFLVNSWIVIFFKSRNVIFF